MNFDRRPAWMFLLGWLVLLSGSFAIARPVIRTKQVPKEVATKPTPPPAKNPTEPEDPLDFGTVSVANSPEFIKNVGVGLPIVTGSLGVSLHGGGAIRVFDRLPIYFSAEAGISFIGSNATGLVTGSLIAMHILPGVYYAFDVKNAPHAHPFAGIAVGPSYLITTRPSAASTTPTTIGAPATPASPNKLSLEFLFRPGVIVDIDSQIAFLAEVRTGVLNGAFLLQPDVGLAFTL